MAKNSQVTKRLIAIVFGASEFPDYGSLDGSPVFAASAEAIVRYLKVELHIPSGSILLLFDDPRQPGDQIRLMRNFVRDRLIDGQLLTDVIFYYCGHGAFLSEDDYVLALKCTSSESKEATV